MLYNIDIAHAGLGNRHSSIIIALVANVSGNWAKFGSSKHFKTSEDFLVGRCWFSKSDISFKSTKKLRAFYSITTVLMTSEEKQTAPGWALSSTG